MTEDEIAQLQVRIHHLESLLRYAYWLVGQAQLMCFNTKYPDSVQDLSAKEFRAEVEAVLE